MTPMVAAATSTQKFEASANTTPVHTCIHTEGRAE
jgi:hypothetical protein